MEWYEQPNQWFDCFGILELEETATEEEIKHAYRQKVKMYHPDNQETQDAEKLRKIQLAYETLKNQEIKEKYRTFSKSMKKNQKNSTKENAQEETESFEEIVRKYKEEEKRIKVHLNKMIQKVEQKEHRFSMVYQEFCNTLKNQNIDVQEFEVTRQKLRSVELACINAIREIMEMLHQDLKQMDFKYEQERLEKILEKLKGTESILTSNYHQARKKLKHPKRKLKKRYIALVPASMMLAGLYLLNPMKEKELDKRKAENDTVIWEEEDFATEEEKSQTDCLLFQEVSEREIQLALIGADVWTQQGFLVVEARDGIHYLLDPGDNFRVILTNYVSAGFYGYKVVCLGIDGYNYTVDLSEIQRTIVEVKPANHPNVSTEIINLEGYGNVIESTVGGKKYLLDEETRYPLVKDFEEYSSLYYSEEFDCDIYCFTTEDFKYYVPADDITKVLKQEWR